ncbi:uncharacterized protein BCR38DRAFT_238140 [Pseudomassariella vexata]|uniref:Thioesterase domain-containing protein n=1 Tax=Pseudomassariella vexata TaxID=1141098 RepID=A0A1Y2DSV0_9PEZI|nr:uncharacterized protein BCR38DRAFT_238140 [Pseudomassariella vexata]ORY62342.1 hypothetical protein BCR38DRAFT_238140 [Pseudomassariella vexata]
MMVLAAHIDNWLPTSQPDLDYFKSLSWCNDILSNPGARPYSVDYTKYTNRPTRGGDHFVCSNFFREDCISRHLSLLLEPGALPALDKTSEPRPKAQLQVPNIPLPSRPVLTASPTADMASPTAVQENPFPIHVDLYTLGPDLIGVPHTIHGGLVTALIDGNTGRVGHLHRDLKKQGYSAYTNVRFLKPMVTDDTDHLDIMIKCQISSRLSEGRKAVVLASVEGPGGVVYATGEAMIVETLWKERISGVL